MAPASRRPTIYTRIYISRYNIAGRGEKGVNLIKGCSTTGDVGTGIDSNSHCGGLFALSTPQFYPNVTSLILSHSLSLSLQLPISFFADFSLSLSIVYTYNRDLQTWSCGCCAWTLVLALTTPRWLTTESFDNASRNLGARSPLWYCPILRLSIYMYMFVFIYTSLSISFLGWIVLLLCIYILGVNIGISTKKGSNVRALNTRHNERVWHSGRSVNNRFVNSNFWLDVTNPPSLSMCTLNRGLLSVQSFPNQNVAAIVHRALIMD